MTSPETAPQTLLQVTGIIIVSILIITYVVIVVCKEVKSRRSGFYTESAREIPTRPYDTPYTGTEPLGAWGATPWAETALAMVPTRCAL
jgi:hypothetical protein